MNFSSGESTASHHPLPGHLAKFRTPFHVFFEKEALEDARELQNGLKSGLPAAELFYSVKTNPLLPLLRSLLAEGWGMEVVGPENLRAAIAAGCPGERLLYNGAAWSRSELEEAIFDLGIFQFTVDSASAAATLAAAWESRPGAPFLRIAIRIHDGESHFGVPPVRGQLESVLRILPEEMAEQLGLHIHRNPHGSPADLEQLREDFRKRCGCIRAALAELRGSPWLTRISFFDLGGGIDSPYVYRPHPEELGRFHNPHESRPLRESRFPKRFELFDAGRAVADTIREQLGSALEGRRVLFEPGRAVCTRAMGTVISVLAVKKHFYPDAEVVLTDGSTAALGPLHRGIYPLAPAGEKPTYVYGCLPHGADWLFQNVRLPPLSEGDRLFIAHTGAYFLPLEARFGHDLLAIVRSDRDERIR